MAYKDKDEAKEYKRQYRLTHAKEIKECRRQYRLTHADEIKEYRLAHADEIKECRRQYDLTHADEIKERKRQYRLTHAEELKEYRLAHRDNTRERRKELRHIRKSQGLCVWCGKKAVPFRVCCGQHLEKRACSIRKRNQTRRVQGFCQCGEKAIPGYSRCLKCLIRGSEWAKAFYKDHAIELCQQVKDRQKRYKDEGRCPFCGVPLIEGEGCMCINCSYLRRHPELRVRGIYNAVIYPPVTR